MKLNKTGKIVKSGSSKLKPKKTLNIIKEVSPKNNEKSNQECKISLKITSKKRRKITKVSKSKVSNKSDVEVKEDEATDKEPDEDDVTEETGNEQEETAGVSGDKGKKKKNNPYTIFVGNLPFTVSPEEVRKHFEKAGKVKEVRLPRDKATNRKRGFGYVQLKNRASYEKALTLHHSHLLGRQINVEYTTQGKKGGPKEEKIKQKNLKLRALAKKGILLSVPVKKKAKKAESKVEAKSINQKDVKVKEKKKKKPKA